VVIRDSVVMFLVATKILSILEMEIVLNLLV
jgi:hypothetical protein